MMQPKVVLCQQPRVAQRFGTVQPMVADVKTSRKREFGRLLNAALDRRQIPEDGRPTWLFENLKKQGGKFVSFEAVRLWLAGEKIPNGANLRELCTRTGIAMSELDPESNKGDKAGNHAALAELMTAWYTADKAGKAHILSAARFAASLGGPTAEGDHSPPLQRSGS